MPFEVTHVRTCPYPAGELRYQLVMSGDRWPNIKATSPVNIRTSPPPAPFSLNLFYSHTGGTVESDTAHVQGATLVPVVCLSHRLHLVNEPQQLPSISFAYGFKPYRILLPEMCGHPLEPQRSAAVS